jgi:predicted glycogen debranching enzyme
MKTPTITLDKEALSRFDEAICKEWLITNGLGGYASSTALGINTRKYHGLLVAALDPPGNRTVCVSKLDEDVLVGGEVYRLGANEFGGSIFPKGYSLLKSFSVSPYPTYKYGFGNVTVEKTVFMPKNRNAVSVIYKVSNSENLPIIVRVYPLLTCRYFHTTLNRWTNTPFFTQKTSQNQSEVTFTHPDATIHLKSTDVQFQEKPNWVEGLFYRAEASRGEAGFDDLVQPGYFEVWVPAVSPMDFAISAAVSCENQTASVALDSVGATISEVNASFNRELEQQSILLDNFYSSHPEVPQSDWLGWLLQAACSLIVQNLRGKKSVIAGYHWFEAWGRDTFISLPGLLLVTGRFSDAKDILQNFMQYCKDGLIPNFISEKSGEPAYNTVDATLWYINAALQYLKYTGDFEFVKDALWEKLQSIIDFHERGTQFGIRVDTDGLLMHGPRLTWMDAEVDGKAVTPRAGKAVEIQALWYNALRTMELLAGKFGEKALAEKYFAMANRARWSLGGKFWNPKADCLFDVLGTEGADASIRPNQVFSVSLDFSPLDNARSAKVVDVVTSELLTPYGLRTLSPKDPRFTGKYGGDRKSRDTSYHNGTVWPWLLGPYITAYLKTQGNTKNVQDYVLQNIARPFFTAIIHQAGLGTISEVYDGAAPHLPGGCISQAWGIAEPLRAYIEDALQIKPKYPKF